MGDIFSYPLADEFLDAPDDQAIVAQVEESKNEESAIIEDNQLLKWWS